MATRLAELRDSDGRSAYADLDDRFVVLEFQAGNEDPAFDEIHRRYSGLARHICQNILRNVDDAEEATQETMLRVYQGLPRFNGRYMVQPWVARIATNVSLDVVRARQRRPVSHLPLDHQDESVVELEDRAPETVVERKLEQARVQDALDALPAHHRRALVMRELEGRSHQEIAQALDITPKQAKALIHRAKTSFRRVWHGERRGLAAIVPIFLAPMRLPEAVRRMIGSAGQAAASSGAAAPLASGALATAGERVAAAAVAIAMATTVGVGAVALKDRIARDPGSTRDHKPRASVVQPPPVMPKAVPKVVSVRPTPAPERRAKKPRKDTKPVAVEPAVTPSEAPSPPVEPSPPPTPTETTPPPIPPAPEWSMKLSAMDKNASLALFSSRASGTAGKSILFNQVANGTLGVLNPISVHAEFWGSADGPDGTAGLWLFLDTPSGRYRYDGTGSLQTVTSPEDGTTTYVFSGTFALAEWPSDDTSTLAAKMLHDGTFELSVSYWQDGTSLYETGLSLSSTGSADSQPGTGL